MLNNHKFDEGYIVYLYGTKIDEKFFTLWKNEFWLLAPVDK